MAHRLHAVCFNPTTGEPYDHVFPAAEFAPKPGPIDSLNLSRAHSRLRDFYRAVPENPKPHTSPLRGLKKLADDKVRTSDELSTEPQARRSTRVQQVQRKEDTAGRPPFRMTLRNRTNQRSEEDWRFNPSAPGHTRWLSTSGSLNLRVSCCVTLA